MSRIFVAILALSGFCSMLYASVGDNSVSAPRHLTLPSVPDTLTDISSRAAYVMMHYWDAMNWTDSLAVADDAFIEQNIADFYSLAPLTDSLSIAAAIDTLALRASVYPQALHTLYRFSAIYLDEPQSPVYNVECFDIVAHSLLRAPSLSATDSLVIAYRATQLEHHRPGSIATDFEFVDRTGEMHTLHDAVVVAPLTLLVFYNPGCRDCEQFEHRLVNDSHLSGLVSRGELSVMFINPYGESVHSDAISLPSQWIVGTSPAGIIEEQELYHIPALPTIFLLDSNARILARYLSPTVPLPLQ